MHNKTKAAPNAPKSTASILYLFSGDKPGLWSYDINGTQGPTLIAAPLSSTSLDFSAVTTVGNTLYILYQGLTEQSNTTIWTLEAGADTLMPIRSASSPNFTYNAITAVGNTLYLTKYDVMLDMGIFTYEIGSQQGPVPIQSTRGLAFTAISVYDNRTLYLTTQGSDGIWLFDLVNRSEPWKIPSTHGLGFNGAVLTGNYIYLAAQGSGGLWKFDILTGDTPVQVPSTQGMGFYGLTAIGNIIYLGATDGSGIWKFDTTTMDAPVNIPATKNFYLPFYG